MKRKILIAILIVLIIIFLAASIAFVGYYVKSRMEENAVREIADNVASLREQALSEEETDGDDTSAAEPTDDPSRTKKGNKPILGESGVLVWLEPSYKKNNDLAGWIRIPDTVIDYPVMYTPYWSDKYLRTAFDGSWALSGTPYIAVPWSPDGNFTIIYGHHMQDGTLFSNLVEFESRDYALSHSIIHFETLTAMYDYEVVFALNSQFGASANERTFRYADYTDLSDPEVFEEFVTLARKAALYDTGVDLKVGDKILVLSTCNYHADNERFAVIARYRAQEDDPEESQTGDSKGS